MFTFLLWLLLPIVLADRPAGAAAVSGSWLLLFFRLVGIAVNGVFEFLRALVLLPARVLRGKPGGLGALPRLCHNWRGMKPVPVSCPQVWRVVRRSLRTAALRRRQRSAPRR